MKIREMVVKNRDPWHKISIRDSYGGMFVLVGGVRPYLSVHTNNAGPKGFGSLGGRTTLRRLAYAILRSVKPDRRASKTAGRGRAKRGA